tara:strand:+ start:714 stop:893 length:180 start_codon:yes stop_codon:yes gene_type:complete
MEIINNYKKVIKINKKRAKCPICKKYANITYMPFCSNKCSDIDLMKWLSNENSINLESN